MGTTPAKHCKFGENKSYNKKIRLKLPAVSERGRKRRLGGTNTTINRRNPLEILEVDEGDMKDALKRVATEPNPERRGWPLLEGGQEHHNGDQQEGQVPHQVQHQNGLRVVVIVVATEAVVIFALEAVRSGLGIVPKEDRTMLVGRDQAGGVASEREGEGNGLPGLRIASPVIFNA